MDNLEKIDEMVRSDPELEEKVAGEIERLIECGEADSPETAMMKAIKNIMGIDVTDEEIKAYFKKTEELGPEELAAASGGALSFANPFTVISDWIRKANIRSQNSAGLYDAAVKNGIEKPAEEIFKSRGGHPKRMRG